MAKKTTKKKAATVKPATTNPPTCDPGYYWNGTACVKNVG